MTKRKREVKADESKAGPVGEADQDDGLIDAVSILSLVYYLLHAPTFWYSAGPVAAFALPAILFPKVRTNPWIWVGIALSLAAGVIPNWFEADNHKYVAIYWSLALACVYWARSETQLVLATNARLLLGGCMFFATLWKVLSPTYLSGEFFEFTLLTDDRFSTFLDTVTSLDAEAIDQNHKTYDFVRSGNAPPGSAVEFRFSPGVSTIAMLCTYWTILIEGLLAAVFLMPTGNWVTRLRHGSLIAFGATTYFLAPVPGFGCLLMLMGMSQSPAIGSSLYRVYFALFVVVQAAPDGVRAIWQFLAT